MSKGIASLGLRTQYIVFYSDYFIYKLVVVAMILVFYVKATKYTDNILQTSKVKQL